MATLRKIISGRKSKANGDRFEYELYKAALEQGFAAIKIPSGCRSLGVNKLIRVQTPFDFIFTKDSKVIVADAKTTSANTFSKSQITLHQLHALLDQERHGIMAGYIVKFQRTERVIFYNASQLHTVNQGEGLNQNEGVDIGSVKKLNLGLIL